MLRTDARTDNVKTVYPLQTKFGGGGIINQFINSVDPDQLASFTVFHSACKNMLITGIFQV